MSIYPERFKPKSEAGRQIKKALLDWKAGKKLPVKRKLSDIETPELEKMKASIEKWMDDNFTNACMDEGVGEQNNRYAQTLDKIKKELTIRKGVST